VSYSYKYGSASHDNPMEFGLYFEESLVAQLDNEITCTYPPARELRDEFLIFDPEGNGDDYNGIISLYNDTDAVDIFGDIFNVTTTGLISAGAGGGAITAGETITIKYYVHPKNFTNPFPSNIKTFSASNPATKEIIQCLLNKCQFMTPANLFRLGYRFADNLCRITLDGGDAPWSGNSFAKVFDTNDSDYYDYLVPHDYHYPYVFTEIRVFTQDKNIYIRPSINRGGTNSSGFFGEGANDYYNLTSSSALYKSGDSDDFIMPVPIGMVSGTSLEVDGRGATSKPSPGDVIIIEVSGYYMPLDGAEVVS